MQHVIMAHHVRRADGGDQPRLRRADRLDGNDLRHCGLLAFAACSACQMCARRQRHVDMADAAVAERVDHRIHHRGERAGAAGLAAALDAERVGRCRRRMIGERERRHVGGARHGVIHERAGEQLAVAVVDRLFHQRLADALHHAAVQLAFDDQRIDDGAEIVDAGIFGDLDDAGFRIDLDFGDMAAVGIGRGAGSVADMGDVEGLRRVGRRLRAVVQFLRQIHDRDRAVGADDGEVAVIEGDVGRRRFERVRRPAPCPSR